MNKFVNIIGKIFALGMYALLVTKTYGENISNVYFVKIIASNNLGLDENDNDVLVFDSSHESGKIISLTTVSKLKRNEVEYLEVGNKRAYKWRSVPAKLTFSKDTTRSNNTILCKIKDEDFGVAYKIECRSTTVLNYLKKAKLGRVYAKDVLYCVAPKIRAESLEFSNLLKGCNGSQILQEYKGAPIKTPEYKYGENQDVYAFYYGNQYANFNLKFSVFPANIMDIIVFGDSGPFKTGNFSAKKNSFGDFEVNLTTIDKLENKFQHINTITFGYSLYGVNLKLRTDIPKLNAYVVPNENQLPIKSWVNLLKFAFDKFGIHMLDTKENTLSRLTSFISQKFVYNVEAWKPEEGNTASLYIDQTKEPMEFAFDNVVDDFLDKEEVKIICIEAAALQESLIDIFYRGEVITKGVNWTVTKPDGTSYTNGHAYNMYKNTFYDPTPGSGKQYENEDKLLENLNITKDKSTIKTININY